MAREGTEVEVAKLPPCDFDHYDFGEKPDAYADARIPRMGSWAYVCSYHFDIFHCELGLGKGQRLMLAKPQPETGIPLRVEGTEPGAPNWSEE